MRSARHRHSVLALAAALSGCAGGTTEARMRQAWLVDALVEDNRPWLSRDLELLAAKYRRMADDPYDFMRGTATVVIRDWTRPGTDRLPTAFVEVPEAARVLLAGDPHPENVGTYAPGRWWERGDRPGVLTLEINDFDGATFGPYVQDVRRAELGLAVLLDGAGCADDCLVDALDGLASGYADEIALASAGAAGWEAEIPEDAPGAVGNLRAKVEEEGPGRHQLRESTTPGPSGARLAFDTGLDDRGRGTLPLREAHERAQARRLVEAYAARTGSLRVLDVGRRYGQGVASLPAVRYVALVDHGGAGSEDDVLLQLREVVDPPAMTGLVTDTLPALYDSQAERIVQTPRALWSRPDADARLGAATDGAQTFKVTTWTAWHQALDHDRIGRDVAAHRLEASDLEDLGEILGRLLARAHARAPTATGGDAAVAIASDLAGREAVFAGERVRDGLDDLDVLARDHRLFREALDELGPVLGADRLEEAW